MANTTKQHNASTSNPCVVVITLAADIHFESKSSRTKLTKVNPNNAITHAFKFTAEDFLSIFVLPGRCNRQDGHEMVVLRANPLQTRREGRDTLHSLYVFVTGARAQNPSTEFLSKPRQTCFISHSMTSPKKKFEKQISAKFSFFGRTKDELLQGISIQTTPNVFYLPLDDVSKKKYLKKKFQRNFPFLIEPRTSSSTEFLSKPRRYVHPRYRSTIFSKKSNFFYRKKIRRKNSNLSKTTGRGRNSFLAISL